MSVNARLAQPANEIWAPNVAPFFHCKIKWAPEKSDAHFVLVTLTDTNE